MYESNTSRCDKILLWRRSSQKFSRTHKAFFHCNVSHNLSPDLNTRSYLLLRCVTATCSPVYPNLWSLETQAQLPLLLTQSCYPPTFSYFWAWAIFQHLARWQALPFFLATLAWTWATPTLAQKPSGHVLANFERERGIIFQTHESSSFVSSHLKLFKDRLLLKIRFNALTSKLLYSCCTLERSIKNWPISRTGYQF